MLLEISFLYVEACALRHAKYKCTKSYLVLLAVLLEADLEKSKFFFGGGWFVLKMADTYVSV